MKKRQHHTTSQAAICLLAIAIVCAVMIGRTAWGIIVVPPPALNPLNQSAVPEPPNIFEYVTNKQAAIKLGKALFWDMQAGSDGVQACASCHFKAGADNRMKNTLNPGTKSGDTTFQVVQPNGTLQPTDFPFHLRAQPDDVQSSAVVRNSNDVVGSQGVKRSQFVSIVPGSAVDNVTPVVDPVFNASGNNTRRVTGRNTPTVINAIFNFTNFHDGRASFTFNGENPFGPADPNAGVWFNDGGVLVKRAVELQFASVASQTTGPPLDDTEMSATGRTFPELGKKMLSLTPLGKQLVHPGDSVLGVISKAVQQPDGTITGLNGLNTNYSQMIKDAFHANLWSDAPVTITTRGVPVQFTQMEANFSFFWGLSIQLYLATQISDQTPFDHWLGGDETSLTDEQKFGFSLFSGIGSCVECHTGIEFTSASFSSAMFVNQFSHNLIELMFVSDGTQVIYDTGFNNTAVTPTTDDIGRDGTAPFTNPITGQPFPLSFSELAELQAQSLLSYSTPILPLFIPSNMPLSTAGSFKVPGLRNVELTAPFFHNGSVMDLEEVVDFYVRGGNFPVDNAADLDPAIQNMDSMQGNEVMHNALVAFLKALTDERVRNESAPFDHPEIFIPTGDDPLTRIAARDLNGVAAPQINLTLNAVLSPTNLDTQTISGTVQAGMTTPVATVNGGGAVNATVTGTNWSADINGLLEGVNTIAVSAVEIASGIQTTITTTMTLDTLPPSLTLNAVSTPTGFSTQVLSGTVEAGATVQVSVNGGAAAGATVTGTLWSYTASLTNIGNNTIVVTAEDASGNVTTLPDATIFRNNSTPPLAANDAAMATMNVSKIINVTANDTGVSNALALNTIVASDPANGTAATNLDGTITYTPDTGFTGTDAFTYTVKDIIGNVSNSATVTVSVTSILSETVTVLRAQFRTATATTGEWIVEGTTTNLTATTITIYNGNSLTGAVIGTASPNEGLWSFRQSGSTILPDATHTISVKSSPLGTSRPAYPVAVR